MRTKLSDSAIEAISTPSKETVLWDSEVPGLGVKVTAKGARTFFCYYRNVAGEQRKPKIASTAIGIDEARKIAREWLVLVARGGDPSHDRKTLRSSPTVAELATRYLEEHARPFKKASSVAQDRTNLTRCVIPLLGTRKVVTLSRRDVTLFHLRMRRTPTTANRVLALLSSMFSFAIRSEIVKENPCRLVPRFRERKIHRDLNSSQFQALSIALDKAGSKSKSSVALLRALLLTGCRRSELVNLRWDEVDLEKGLLNLADSKTGEKTVFLNDAAVEIIREQVGEHLELVFPSPSGKPIRGIYHLWNSVRVSAGIPDFRIHDLRHNFASMAIASGASLPTVGRLLGHKSCVTTQRYAVLAETAARAAAQSVGQAFGGVRSTTAS
jgi:integrase